MFKYLTTALLACIPLFGCGEMPDGGETWEQSTYSIRNGHREPGALELTEGEILAIGWIHTAGYPNEPFCTGTITSNNLVITAAHCLRDRNVETLSFSLGTLPESPKITLIPQELVIHPTLDLGLIVLTEDVTLKVPELEPIATNFTTLETVKDKIVGSLVEVAGYGQTWDDSRSGRYFATLTVDDITEEEVVVNGQGRQGLCQGDSGGPLLIPTPDGTPLVVAVEKSGESSCVGQDFMVRLDIASDWMAPYDGRFRKIGDQDITPPLTGPSGAASVHQEGQPILNCAQSDTTPITGLGLLMLAGLIRRRR